MITDLIEDATLDVADEQVGSGPSMLDGSPARALVALSPHGAGQAAAWLVNFVGEPCGAWVLDLTTKTDALGILRLCDRRAVIDGDSRSAEFVAQLAVKAGIKIRETHVRERLAPLDALLSAIADARQAYSQAVLAHGDQEGKKLAPLAWRTELPESVDVLRRRPLMGWSGIGSAPQAFVESMLARQLMLMWSETETARMRRPYLRARFGHARVLPEVWRNAATAAYQTSPL